MTVTVGGVVETGAAASAETDAVTDFQANRRQFAFYSAQGVAATQVSPGVGLSMNAVDGSDIVTNISGEPIQRFSVATAGIGNIMSTASGAGALAVLSPNHSPRLLIRVQLPAASANVTSWLAGFFTTTAVTAAGAFLRIATTGNVFFVTDQAGTETTTDLGVLSRVAVLGFEISTADAGVTWLCKNQAGTVLATHTTNVPAVGTALAYGVAGVTATGAVPWGVASIEGWATFA